MEIKMRGTTLEDFHGIVDGEIVQHLKTNGFSFIDAGRRRSLVKKTQAQEKVKGFVGKAVKGEGAEAKAEWTEFSGGLVKKTPELREYIFYAVNKMGCLFSLIGSIMSADESSKEMKFRIRAEKRGDEDLNVRFASAGGGAQLSEKSVKKVQAGGSAMVVIGIILALVMLGAAAIAPPSLVVLVPFAIFMIFAVRKGVKTTASSHTAVSDLLTKKLEELGARGREEKRAAG